MDYFKGSTVTYMNETCLVLDYDENSKTFELFNMYTGEMYRKIPSTSVALCTKLKKEELNENSIKYQ
jgi:hypothetical protein